MGTSSQFRKTIFKIIIIHSTPNVHNMYTRVKLNFLTKKHVENIVSLVDDLHSKSVNNKAFIPVLFDILEKKST